MTIDALFEELEEYFMFEDINGEFTLDDNEIIWNYTLDAETEEEEEIIDEENEFDFEETKSNEELLYEAYEEDLEKIKMFLDEMGEFEKWSITDPEILDNNISITIA